LSKNKLPTRKELRKNIKRKLSFEEAVGILMNNEIKIPQELKPIAIRHLKKGIIGMYEVELEGYDEPVYYMMTEEENPIDRVIGEILELPEVLESHDKEGIDDIVKKVRQFLSSGEELGVVEGDNN